VPHDASIGQGRALLKQLVEGGVVSSDGAAGPHAEAWVEGGFARIYVDDPGRETLYANRLGGFRVRCPETGANVVPAFASAMSAWREGGVRRIEPCPACGGGHDLAELELQPPGAFGRWAWVVADVATASLRPEAVAVLHETLGPGAWVRRR